MKSLSKKIIIAYVVFTGLFFLFSYVFFEPSSSSGKNIIAAILTSLGDLLYWLTVIGIYLLSMLASGIIGMIIFRNNRRGFVAFRAITIGAGILFLIGVIASYF